MFISSYRVYFFRFILDTSGFFYEVRKKPYKDIYISEFFPEFDFFKKEDPK